MFARSLHILISLKVVVGAYAFYRLLLVPWIVPVSLPTAPVQANLIHDARTPLQIERLKRYFNEGDWETQQPIVIEKPEFALLLQNYQNTEDGQLKIVPCTFVFFPAGRPSAGHERQVFIMRAPKGAVLEFEGGCDLARAKIGRLQGGRLLGEVSIEGHSSGPSPNGEFSLLTRDIELREDRLWSRHDVQFQIGRNRGYGRELQMQFNLDNEKSPTKQNSAMSTVEKLELLRDVRLFLEIDSQPFLPGTPLPEENKPPLTSTVGKSSPVEIQCQGPFQLDTNKMAATFSDQVEVVRHHEAVPPDRLTCDQLTIYFAEKPTKNTQLSSGKTADQIQLTKIVAKGNPVSVSTPVSQAAATGDHLEIELASQHLILRGDTPVTLTHNSSVLTAMHVDYEAGDRSDLGKLKAVGPGRLVTVPSDKKQEAFEASWKNMLQIQPHKKGHVISLSGGSRIQYAEASALQAEKIWLWLDKAPQVSSQPKSHPTTDAAPAWKQFSPHSVLALDKVRLDAEKISAVSDRLEVWFENQSATADSDDSANPEKNNTLLGSAIGSHDNTSQPGMPYGTEPAGSHYHIRGDLIQLTIAVPEKGNPTPTAASVSGNVRLIERVAEPGDDPPLTVSGDHLDLFGADTAQTVVSLTGKPARATAQSAAITGASLQLERGSDRIWVNGAGSMQLPINRDLQGKPLDTAERLDITWQEKMLFDGQTISFKRGVLAKTKHQELHTAQLVVTLNQRVSLSQSIERDSLEIMKIACDGGVQMENHSMELTRRISHDRLVTTDLVIEQPSGRLRGSGPGTVTSVRRGSINGAPVSLTPATASRPATVGPTNDTNKEDQRLSYLQIEFLQGIEGNIHKRELTFRERVNCTYGPVNHWKEQVTIDAANGPVGDEVLMTCNQLTVRQMGSSQNQQQPVEMEAIGDAVVNGETFSASGHRLTYTTGKELLVLEGAGQSFAQLSRHESNTGPSNLTAQKIYFWRADNRVQLEGIRLFNGSLPERQ